MSTDGLAGQPDEDPDRPPEGRPAREPGGDRAERQDPAETRTRQDYYDALAAGHGDEIVTFTSLMAARPATERPEWGIPLSRDAVDRCGLGVIDERAKKFSPAERR